MYAAKPPHPQRGIASEELATGHGQVVATPWPEAAYRPS